MVCRQPRQSYKYVSIWKKWLPTPKRGKGVRTGVTLLRTRTWPWQMIINIRFRHKQLEAAQNFWWVVIALSSTIFCFLFYFAPALAMCDIGVHLSVRSSVSHSVCMSTITIKLALRFLRGDFSKPTAPMVLKSYGAAAELLRIQDGCRFWNSLIMFFFLEPLGIFALNFTWNISRALFSKVMEMKKKSLLRIWVTVTYFWFTNTKFAWISINRKPLMDFGRL